MRGLQVRFGGAPSRESLQRAIAHDLSERLLLGERDKAVLARADLFSPFLQTHGNKGAAHVVKERASLLRQVHMPGSVQLCYQLTLFFDARFLLEDVRSDRPRRPVLI